MSDIWIAFLVGLFAGVMFTCLAFETYRDEKRRRDEREQLLARWQHERHESKKGFK